MKKWFVIVGSIILIMVIGTGMITLHGHGQRSYNACVRLGQNDVIDGNYRDALNYYQGAQKVDPEGRQARNAMDQTQGYVSGNHYLARRKLTDAAKDYRRSIKIGAVAALTRRSMLNYKRVNLIQRGVRRFTLLYDQALILNHRRDFKGSIDHLERIVNDSSSKLKYFKPFRARVFKLIRADRHDRRSVQVAFGVKGSRDRAGEFKLRAPRIVLGHPSKVTINEARREIRRAGINVSEMSDHDVANLIRQAARHHTGIRHYAKENY